MSTASIKPAATGNYTHKYNPYSIASIDFGDFYASRVVEVIKGDKFNFKNVRGTLRLAPQIFPAYGKNTLKSAAFFVPTTQLVESYDQFRNNKSVWKGKSVRIPHFAIDEINKMFFEFSASGSETSNYLSTVVSSCQSPNSITATTQLLINNGSKWDLCYYDHINQTMYWLVLNTTGRRFYKHLKMLGYDFFSYPLSDPTTVNYQDFAAQDINALPLIALAKIYVDYFYPSQLYNTCPLVQFLQAVHDNEILTTSEFTYSITGYLQYKSIFSILNYIRVPFERNEYLDAWNSPNSPTGVSPDSERFWNFSSQGVLGPYLPERFNPNGVPYKDAIIASKDDTTLYSYNSNQSSYTSNGLTQFGQNFLKATYRFIKRNGLFGSKSLEQVANRFGIDTSDWNNEYCSKLYEGSSEIDYNAVLSNTDSYDSVNNTGKTLGAYAGFGVTGLNFSFDYKSSQFGYIIVLHWLQITPIIVRGMDAQVIKTKPFEFYTPEYDGQTLRAIPQCEISTDKYMTQIGNNGDLKVFGFTDIYEEYRNMRDNVVGDFVLDENGARNFFFGRDFSYWRSLNNIALQPQTTRIQMMAKTGLFQDCTDPFQAGPSNGDRYYLFVKYDITANRHISSKGTSVDLNGEGDMSVQIGGTNIQ